MNGQRQTVGKKGEDEACLFLTENGHKILERNWRSSHLELDIISLAEDGLHFVEVKSRTAPVMADPEVNVDRDKMRKLVRAAQAYLHSPARKALGDLEIYFDILTVVFDEGKTTINYYPKAFIPFYV